ncbi:BTAD domain-containing putative transcriptional regulator [Egibacter rhizosphaerae]|uniref:BTAD domain-containing putative transcriptional regulator n=1 Tax=Egibacter rhizosphaerae TaxID=1670831 RepID=UPI0013F16B17|nr:BTAD domain-containing putative transcriptional regulator [Egibacter rhizosphaerae]
MNGSAAVGSGDGVEFGLLGPLRVRVGGAEVAVGSVRQRALLAALLVAGESVVSADRLVESVWDRQAPQDPDQALQTHVSRLRRVLERAAGEGARDLLVTRPPGYALLVAVDQVDARRFERLADQARAADSPAEVVELADRALGLWRGSPLAEFDREFARVEAARLEERRLGLLEARAEGLLALGRPGEVVAELESLVDAHPVREQLHAWLMLALYRCGRQAEALGVHRRLRDRLVEQLGVEPSPALRRLEQDILQQHDALAGPAPSAVSPHTGLADRGASRLPVEVTSFVAREGDVERVGAALGRAPLVTLIGPGGVGKTRLALRAAHEVAMRFDDAARLCDLAAVEDAGAVPAAVAGALGIQPHGSQDLDAAVVAHLRGLELLLLLDNCEHVLDGASRLVDRIVRACPHVRVLATSRQPLGVVGEQVWPVAPLETAAAGDPSQAPAVELFLRRAEAAEPGAVFDDDVEVVAEICRRLDGLPLAIELAAARIRSMTPVDITARLDRRFELLASDTPTADARHRSLQAVVDVSYALLSQAARRLFDRLAVFVGGFTLDAAEQVCADDVLPVDEVAARLGELVDHSLVVVERRRERARYRLLETLRAYAEARLVAQAALATWKQRHAAYCSGLAEQAAAGVVGSDEARWVVLCDAELANLRAAHRWALTAGHVDVALRLPALLHHYAYFRLRDEVFRWAEEAAARPEASDRADYAPALAAAAAGCVHRGELDRASGYRDEAQLAASTAAELARLRVLELEADMTLYRGLLDDVDRLAQEVVTAAQALDRPFEEAIGHLHAVLAAAYGGRTDDAMARFAHGWAVAEATGSPTMHASYRMLEGELWLDADPERAAAALAEAVDVAGSVGNCFVEGVARVSLASLHARRGEAPHALASFADSVAHWRRSGDWVHQWTTLRNLVVLLVRLGVHEPAAVLHGAIASASSGASAFGADAERMAAADAAARESLGPQRHATAAARGHAMDDHETVAYALAVIERLGG